MENNMKITGDSTISEARRYLKQNVEKGVDCPCCNQFAKVYKRRINVVMSRTLIRLYHLYQQNPLYHHVKEIVSGISDTGTNDFSKLLYWGLIEEKVKDPTNTKTRTSGYWRISQKGIDFVLNKISVPSYCYVYNGEAYQFSDEYTNIEKTLDKKFNYVNLMKNK